MRNLNSIKDPDIKMILQMPCKFEDYEVSYDDEKMIKFYQRKAKLCGVKTTQSKPHQTDYETCEGTVENCIRYLRDFIEGDYGYQAGMCLTIDNVKPTDKKFVIAFKKFLDWLSAGNRFADFKDGVAEGTMKDFLMK